jgi:hypothetical protein
LTPVGVGVGVGVGVEIAMDRYSFFPSFSIFSFFLSPREWAILEMSEAKLFAPGRLGFFH